jgi:hypothetical protein
MEDLMLTPKPLMKTAAKREFLCLNLDFFEAFWIVKEFYGLEVVEMEFLS